MWEVDLELGFGIWGNSIRNLIASDESSGHGIMDDAGEMDRFGGNGVCRSRCGYVG